ncbi:phosphodiesterase [Bdellovibrio sp. HCB288]|uniref:phosphodiesterase n=1 Tax=Bdellovibrio sp. HCB288 TaxID=3394355 RepID=UPI0039B59633
MKTSRRGFLQLSASSIIGYSALSSPLFSGIAEAASGFSGNIPICQHMTNSHSTQITVLTDGYNPYAYRVFDSQGRPVAVQIWDHEIRKCYHQGIDKLHITGMDPKLSYYLQVIDKNRGTVLDERKFKSLKLSSRSNLRFALVSCASDFFKTHARVMWDNLFAQKPDFIFLVGDAVYADFGCPTTEDNIWIRFCQTRSRLRHFRQPSLIPTLAVWDDHDYGLNNMYKTFKYKVSSKRTFDLFFGSRNTDGFKRTMGVGSRLTAFGHKFFFMDDRYYRDEAQCGGMMWGSEQQEQFLENICDNSKPTWIFNGSQFFTGYHKQESFAKDYGKNFVDLLAKLRRCDAPVAFGSGDVHFSEVTSVDPKYLGYRTYEYTSSAIHSINFPVKLILKNPRRERFAWHHNFVIIDSQASKGAMKVNAMAINARNRIEFTHQATIKRS